MRLAHARRMLRALLASAALLLPAALAGCASLPPTRAHGMFVERQLDDHGQLRRYQVFVPATAAAGRRPPVILFLHGSGERGDDGHAPTLVGLGPVVRAQGDRFPAIVVFPQAPQGSEWSAHAAFALAALEAARREFGGDPRRQYLTGLSMGRDTLFVTAVADASDPYAEIARRLRQVPIWIFHGARDDVVPPEDDRRLAAALRAAGARDARYTEFADANHNSWDPAYAGTPALWDWLFAQRR